MTTTPTKTAKPIAPLSAPALAADLDAGLRRLKLAAIRRTAPEVLLTAKTQRWTPEEVLRTLVETELAARDASNIVNRLKAAGFPVAKTIDSFDVPASSIQPKVFDYLASLEWVRTQQNLAIIGPAGTGKSHTLIGLGIAAIHAGHKVRYFTAADLIETLYRGLADNTVGKIIETLLRVDLVILDLSRPRNYAEHSVAAAWVGRRFRFNHAGLFADTSVLCQFKVDECVDHRVVGATHDLRRDAVLKS
jgi:DNA replication protein DnaC